MRRLLSEFWSLQNFVKSLFFRKMQLIFVQKNVKISEWWFEKPPLQTITLQSSVFQLVESKSDGLWFISTF